MKKQHIYILLTAFVLNIVSCSKDDTEIIQEPVKSSAKQITGFMFKAIDNNALTEDITTVIDEQNKTITATMPNGTDINSLTPTLVVSEKAVVDQTGAKDFSSPIDYLVTAEDGSTTSYKVTVIIAANSAKEIVSFVFKVEDNELYGEETIMATVDEANKTITATVSYSANAALLLPHIAVSPNATISPEGPQDFSNPITYTITAEDGSTAIYQVSLEITFTDRDALIAIYNANPNNTLNWDLQDRDISNWTGVQANNNGNIIVLHMDSKNLDILPSELGQLKELQNLSVYNNLLVSIPAAIGELSSLTELYLTGNKLIFLPEEIGKLSNLQNLEVDGNQLTAIPASIGQLLNLDNIYLQGNKLISLPSEIGNLTKLTTIYLSENELTSLPEEIGGLTSLTGLDLKNNKLTSFPMELTQLKSFSYLNLSHNLLASIPKQISDFTSLTGLNLNGNKLTTIPKEMGLLTNLTSLVLTENMLTSIPQDVCNLVATGTALELDPDVKCE
ncbi:hypothetical protein ACOCEA_09135 [Maribacter sp. CXY002]|uniref:hypothetical protein n=1 Tax=Maribacter luteocoastalis TaxID=3407671 RepID=UPI003B685270